MTDYLAVKDWDTFQHYSTRRPPWIKLYRSVLDDEEWGKLSDKAARILMQIWLVASENVGVIKGDSVTLAWRLRRPEKEVVSAVDELLSASFLNDLRDHASKPSAPDKPNATLEKRREEIDGVFNLFWKAYPRRAGSNPKAAARKAWEACSVPRDVLLEGATRYSAFCDATNKTGTEYVKQAVSWLSPKFEGWAQDWTPPEKQTTWVDDEIGKLSVGR